MLFQVNNNKYKTHTIEIKYRQPFLFFLGHPSPFLLCCCCGVPVCAFDVVCFWLKLMKKNHLAQRFAKILFWGVTHFFVPAVFVLPNQNAPIIR